MVGLKVILIWLLVAQFSIVDPAQIMFKSSKCGGNRIEGVDCETGEVRFSSRYKRSEIDGLPLEIIAFGKKVNLLLKEREGALFSSATPIYKLLKLANVVYRMDGSNDMTEYAKARTFEDVRQSASVSIEVQPDGSGNVKGGYIGSVGLFFNWNPQTQAHQFYKVGEETGDPYFVNTNPPKANTYNQPTYLPYPYNNYLQYFVQAAKIPEIIYPEILVVVDYQLVIDVGEDNILMYMIHRWNQVDMIFRGLSSPTIKLSIAGIVIPMSQDSLQYLSEGSYYISNRKNVIIDVALNSCKGWMFRHNHIIPINSYDLAMTMISRRMDSQNNQRWSSYSTNRGASFMGTVCETDYYRQEVIKLGVISDDGSYIDVIETAHEVAHILGANHDDGICTSQTNYIMDAVLHRGSHHLEWSQCTVEGFQELLRKNPMCLLNKPKV